MCIRDRLQGEADLALAEAQALKLQARLEDLTVRQMERSSRAERALRPISTGWHPGARASRRAVCYQGSSRKIGWLGSQAESLGEESAGTGLPWSRRLVIVPGLRSRARRREGKRPVGSGID